jgi:polyhydroxybutyrate depolymerase
MRRGCRRLLVRVLPSLAAATLSASPLHAQTDAGDGGTPPAVLSRSVPGFPGRPYLLHVPVGAAPSAPLPAVLVLHGGGGSADGMRRITCPNGDLTSPGCMDALGDRDGFYTVYPNGTPSPLVPSAHTWNAGGGTANWECVSGLGCSRGVDDVGYIGALLDDLEGAYRVDASRVFATGLSDGAAMAHRLGCALSRRIAAIGPVSGGDQYETSAPCAPGRPVPVLEMHGTADPCWAFDGGAAACLATDGKSKIDIPTTVATWIAVDGCAGGPTLANLPDTVPGDGTQTQTQTYATCGADAGVVLYVIAGGGHTWPGGYQYGSVSQFGVTSQDFSANQVLWDFFSAHPGAGAGSSAVPPAVPATGLLGSLALAGALLAFGTRLRRRNASWAITPTDPRRF